jgi:hypothetical protein
MLKRVLLNICRDVDPVDVDRLCLWHLAEGPHANSSKHCLRDQDMFWRVCPVDLKTMILASWPLSTD